MKRNYYIVAFKDGKTVFVSCFNEEEAKILAQAVMIRKGLTSEDYEFYILTCNWCDNDTWIILDANGNIRVWDNTSDELFFGKESEYVFEKTDRGEYMQVAV